MSRKAFTLIELLVVIAIIAILAAILFPVFAQAKLAAKKTAALSQTKQAATGMLLYTGDNDDMGPTGTPPNLSSPGRWKFDVYTMQSPAGWFANPVIQDEHALVWHNTTQPYIKNWDMFNLPGTRQVNVTWATSTTPQLKEPKGVNLTYNGLLQHYSMTAIASPSQLPMLWQGIGDATRVGSATTQPRLRCNGTGSSCVFNPGGPPMGDMAPTERGDYFNIIFNCDAKYHVYGKTALFVSADSSARAVNVGDGNRLPSPASANRVWPIQFVDDKGCVSSTQNFIRGRYAGQSLYTAAFMPDNTFQN